MGANTYTTDDLISDVELLGHIPLGNNTLTPAKILQLANMESQLGIMAQILSTRGGYYTGYLDYTPADDGLYVIPSDCVAGALINVQLIQNTTIVPVNQIELSEQFATNSPTSTSYGYYLQGNYVQIIPAPNVGNPRFWYTKRTGKMILTSQACQVTAVAANVISVASIPSTILVGSAIDGLGDQPPFNVLGSDVIQSIVGTDITVVAPITGLAVGDWLALTGQTPVPQIPVEFRPLLAQRVVVTFNELQGYLDKLKASQAKLEKMEKETFSLITPRVKTGTKIINPINGGFLSPTLRRQTNFPAARNG